MTNCRHCCHRSVIHLDRCNCTCHILLLHRTVTDNNHFFHHGVRGVVVACGMNNCHSCGEYSSAADLTAAAKLVETLILSRD